MGRDAQRGIRRSARRTFTTDRLQISHPIAVARIAELQLQQLQHFQLFADSHLQVLQHFWHNAADMQGLWHTIAILPLPPFMPICPSGMDDLDDSQNSHILILISFLIAAWSIPPGYKLSTNSYRIFLSTINYQP
jgi:hypothetical protein